MSSHKPHDPHCLVELEGNTLVVTMNRPEARNALSAEMMSIMSEAWDRANTDPEVKVVILTGAAGCFCAGADLKSMSSSAPSDKFYSGEFDPAFIKPLLKGFRLTKPLIAAVEGPAIAGGTEILQATDIRVAGESARFGVSEPKWGLYPLGGSAVRLPRQLPYTVAVGPAADRTSHQGPGGQGDRPHRSRRSRRRGTGQGARARGPDLRERSARRAGHLKTIRDSEGKHEDDCWKDDAAVGAAVFASDDAKEGPRAFAEKRAPQFQGR